jgi:hypothetical protein
MPKQQKPAGENIFYIIKERREPKKSKKGDGVFTGDTPFDPLAKVKKTTRKIKSIAKQVLTGNIGFTAKTQSVVDKYADQNITAVKLHRTPLGKTLMTVLNLASGNTLKDKIKNSPYDKLFHLFMCIETTNGSFSIEKNEVISAEASCKLPPYTETRTIQNIPSGLTVKQSLENTKNKLGDKFITYEASNNNCQHFVTAFLQANNIGDNNDIAFVKQDTDSLFEGNPAFKKIVNSVTNLGSAFSNIVGAGATDPCWEGYEQIGMKKKRGKKVPNCVPAKSGKGFVDLIKSVGSTAGKPYEISGVNPFNLGYSVGHDLLAPELMKVLPPEKVKKALSGKGVKNIKSADSNIGKMEKSRKPNSWIQHVQAFAKQQNMKYNQALKDPACKLSYKKGGGMPITEIPDDEMVAIEYDSKNLGATGKVKL